MPKAVVYISGPLTAPTEAERQAHVARAVEVGLHVYRAGAVPFIPHLNHQIPGLTWADFMAWDIPMVRRCDGLIRLPGESKGAAVEEAVAVEAGLPVLKWPAPGALIEVPGTDAWSAAAVMDEWLRNWISRLEVRNV